MNLIEHLHHRDIPDIQRPAHIEPGRVQRVDRPLMPPDAMGEILVNALIHHDYSIAGGAVSLAIFDARAEVARKGGIDYAFTNYPEKIRLVSNQWGAQ